MNNNKEISNAIRESFDKLIRGILAPMNGDNNYFLFCHGGPHVPNGIRANSGVYLTDKDVLKVLQNDENVFWTDVKEGNKVVFNRARGVGNIVGVKLYDQLNLSGTVTGHKAQVIVF